MKLSAKAEYACLAVISLACREAEQAPIRVREIAEAHEIPERYLVHVLIQLKAAGLVHSARGAAGGYRLARPADGITLGEVLRAIDGPGEPPRETGEPLARALASALEDARAAELAVLSKVTIADLAGRASQPDWVI